MQSWTNDTLLTSIRFRSGLPSTTIDEYFDDANLYQLLNEELTSWLTPLVLEMRQEYLVHSIDFPFAGNNTFYIPAQAVGGRLRCVRMTDGQHNPIGPQLEQIDIRDVRNTFIPGIWGAFYIEDNALILIGNMPQGYFLRMDFETRLSTCVSATACAQITALSGSVVTCGGGFPAGYTNGAKVDFVAGDSPYTLLGTAVFPTPVGNVATFAAALPSAEGRSVQVGDWVCLAGTSPYVGLPQEVTPLVAQYMATKVLEIKGDTDIQVTQAKYKELLRQVKGVLGPRSLGNRKTPGSMLGNVLGPGLWGFPSGGF